MLFTFYTLGAFGLTGFVLLIRAAFSAPYGVEDHRGFHRTGPVEEEDRSFPVNVSLTTEELGFFSH